MNTPRRIRILGSGNLAAVAAVALLSSVRSAGFVVEEIKMPKPRIENDSRWSPQSRAPKQKAQWKRERSERKS